MIKPERLRKGDTVAIASLSYGMGGEDAFLPRYELGKRRLEEVFGLNVIVMPHALKGIEFLYENPQARAQDLMDAFKNPEIKGIICMIGGDDAIRLLPHVDFDVIRENPKIFMGFSDTTSNHFMMHKAGLVSFYGPCVLADFGENVTMYDYTVNQIKSVLFEPTDRLEIPPSSGWTSEFLDWANRDNDNTRRILTPDTKGYEILQGKGVARGKLIGGCVEVLPMIIGTDIWPTGKAWDDALLFLEIAEDYTPPEITTYILRGMAAQGILGRISGIIFGKPRAEKFYNEYKDVLTTAAKEAGRADMPILYNASFGHNSPICTLPYGITAEIDCDAKTLHLTEPAVL
ncbi:MAG: LD-carboxypeptidase [Defluviitaleaceae bacterium]|nr:LD-carboxypeptidase [Defluviitaleaceae bacterium]